MYRHIYMYRYTYTHTHTDMYILNKNMYTLNFSF